MLTTARGWFNRWGTFALGAMSRAFMLGASGVVLSSGSAGVAPAYAVNNSMSTLARFPWVWTAVRAVASDAAGLPLVAVARRPRVKGRRSKKRDLVDDTALDLLDNPNPGMSGYLFRKQLWVDYLLTGNAYIWVMGVGEMRQAYRIHPAWIEPIPGPLGIAAGYKLKRADGESSTLDASEIIHIRDTSWADTTQSMLGESPIRCLHDDLLLELGSKSLAAEQSAKGKPDIILSVDAALGNASVAELQERWEVATAERHGAFITGKGVTATVTGWSPEEMQFSEGRAWTRDSVLAVFEVPPARAGLSSANYGTQKQQMRTYWESIVRRVRAFGDAFSRLAGRRIRIEHDFSDVEALQVSYTERLMRVTTWVGLGATPEDAAMYEGFDEAPVGPTVEDFRSPRPIGRPAEEPQGDKAIELEVVLASYLLESRCRFEALAVDVAAGVELGIVQRWESERLFGVLEAAGVTPSAARWFADDVPASTLESVRLLVSAAADDTELEGIELDIAAFSPARARALADRIRSALEVAA